MVAESKFAWLPLPDIHDHFSGFGHCVECEGECRQTGIEFAYSELIRWIFEEELDTFPEHWVIRRLLSMGVDVQVMRRRAKEAEVAIHKE